MRVMIATDYLVQRDWVARHIEELLTLYPNAVVGCLVFFQGKLGDRIENRTIISSSRKKLPSKGMEWTLSLAAQSFHIPNDIDLLITLSRGHIHKLKKPPGCRHISYRLGEYNPPSIISWLLRNDESSIDKNIYASKGLTRASAGDPVLAPFFSLGKHETDPIESTAREIDFVIHLRKGDSEIVERMCEELKENYLFYADEQTLDELIKDAHIRSEHCYKKNCHGAEQKLFSNTKLFVDFSGGYFEPLSMQALSAGVAVLVSKQEQLEYLGDEYAMICQPEDSIERVLESEWLASFDQQKARRHALRFNGRVFKSRFKQVLV